MLGLGQCAYQLAQTDEALVPFANQLQQLARDFEDEAILALLQRKEKESR